MSHHNGSPLLYDSKPVKHGFWMVICFLIIAFWGLCFFTDAKPLGEYMRLVGVSFAMGVVVAYMPEAIKRSLKPSLGSADMLLIGITLGWLGQAFQGIWILLWRLAGQPSWMINSDFTNALTSISILGCSLHLLAPGAINGAIPRRNMIQVGALAGISTAVALLFIGNSDVVATAVRRMRPFIEQPRSNYDSTSLPFKMPGDTMDTPILFVRQA